MPSATPGRRTRAPGARHDDSALVQAAAQRSWNTERVAALLASPRRGLDFLTAGTSGRPVESLFDAMALPGLDSRLLLDIRATPFSRHVPAWNHGAVEAAARTRGVEYRHRPDLGVPSAVRRAHLGPDADLGGLFGWYDRHVLTEAALTELRPLLDARPVLLCTELSPLHCHRGRLAIALERRFSARSLDV